MYIYIYYNLCLLVTNIFADIRFLSTPDNHLTPTGCTGTAEPHLKKSFSWRHSFLGIQVYLFLTSGSPQKNPVSSFSHVQGICRIQFFVFSDFS